VSAVEKFRDSMVALRGRYVFPMRRGENAVLLTEAQRDVVVEAYAEQLRRAMWVVMVVTFAGLISLAVVTVAFDFEPHFWMVVPVVLVALIPTFTIRPFLRRKVEAFGVLPTAALEEYAVLRQKQLAQRPWSALLLPGVLLPVVALRLHPHVPPVETDDWLELAMLAGLAALMVWAVVRKLMAGRSVGY
jgi:hypothetical protein